MKVKFLAQTVEKEFSIQNKALLKANSSITGKRTEISNSLTKKQEEKKLGSIQMDIQQFIGDFLSSIKPLYLMQIISPRCCSN